MSIRLLLPTLLAMSALSTAAIAQDPPPAADTFEREVLKSLKASHTARRGVRLHIGGTTLAGTVIAIGPDVVVLGNRESARILVRRERIDAVEADE